MQGKNNDQYLRKDLDGKYLVSGTLFADYRNGALNIELEYNDTIVTLSTCSYEFDNARYIVMGRLNQYKESITKIAPAAHKKQKRDCFTNQSNAISFKFIEIMIYEL